MSTRPDTAAARPPRPWLLLAILLTSPAAPLAAPGPDAAAVHPQGAEWELEPPMRSASARCRITITVPPPPLRLVTVPGTETHCIPVPESSPVFLLRVERSEPVLVEPWRDQPVPLPLAAPAGPTTVLVEPMR